MTSSPTFGLSRKRRLAILALAALALIWGYNWVVMKIAVGYAAPFTFAAWRVAGGALALALVAVLMRRPLRPQYPLAVLPIGLFQTAGMVGFATWAVVTAGAGEVSLLVYTMPFWLAIAAWPVFGERLRPLQGAAIALALAGVVALLCAHGLHAPFAAYGLALLSGLCWAVGSVLAKRLQRDRRVDAINLTLWQMIFAAVVLIVAAVFVPGRATDWTPVYVAALLYNILPATALAWFLWVFILRELPAREAGMGTLSNPIVSIVAAWIQLGARPNVVELAGMAAVIGALAILVLGG